MRRRNCLEWARSGAKRPISGRNRRFRRRDALAVWLKSGCRRGLAWTGCDYGVGAGFKPAPTRSHKEKTVALLDESPAISTELGMHPLMERVIRRLEMVHPQPVAAAVYPDGLTEREVEVLGLIATGKTNLEIAGELAIAEGTARRHVANIDKKTAAANRVEAAAYAGQRGLSR